MSIAFTRLKSSFRPVNATPIPPIPWLSAFAGLVLAVIVVVSISWMAAPRRLERTNPVPVVAVAPATEVQVVPTPIPPPAIATPEPAPPVEKVRVSNTNGSNLNLRARAGERGQRLKSVPEGSVLEIIGADETADGIVWRNVRDAAGASGYVAATFVVKVSAQP